MRTRAWLKRWKAGPGRPLPGDDRGGTLYELESVEVVLGDRCILRGLDLTIPAEGITAITGPSGSGKSTLARLCNRLIDPTRGVVRFRGVDLTELDVLALRRQVGFMFQRPTTFPGSVADNLSATGVEDPERWRELLEAVDLDPELVLGQDAASLSGGEAQRVCMVRALLLEPQVLIADEPTAAVDAATRQHLEGLVRAMALRGVPVVWITHDLAQLERLADRVLVLIDGAVAATGTPGEIAASHHPGVRALFAEASRGVAGGSGDREESSQ